MSTTQNVMPARALPQSSGAGAARVQSHLVFACAPAVGATTLASVLAARSGPPAKRQRVLTAADRPQDAADGGREVLDFASDRTSRLSFVSMAEALDEGVIVDCAAGAVDRILAEAAETRIGHLLAEVDITAVLVVGRTPASARRASAHLKALDARGGDLGVKRTVIAFNDAVGGHDPFRSDAHASLRKEAATAGVGVAVIPVGDLDRVERSGFGVFEGVTETELAGKLGMSAIRAGAELARFTNWLKAAGGAVRTAEASSARPAAKAG